MVKSGTVLVLSLMSAMSIIYLAEWRQAPTKSEAALQQPEFDLKVLNSARRPAYLPIPAGSLALASAKPGHRKP